MQKMSKQAQSVIIVGGGHVGLSFALMLSHFGIASTVIEKSNYPTITPNDDPKKEQYLDVRNTAISRKTVQIYKTIGIWQSLQSHACRIDRVKIFEKNSFGHATLNKHQEKVESFGQVIENAHLGHTLLLKARQDPLISIIDGVCVVSVNTTYNKGDDLENLADPTADNQACGTIGNGVNVELDNGRICCASLVVACDGQNSTVRTLLNIGTSCYDYNQTGIVGVVHTQKPHEHTAIECFSPLGPLALLPLTDNAGAGDNDYQVGHRRSVVFICKTGEQQQYLNDDAKFLQALNDAFGDVAGAITQAGKRGAYPLIKILAKQQVKNRVVIMGNAAHTLHPVAGQGFNLCVRDAFYLANRLKNAYDNGQDFADKTLLDNYQKMRLTDQKRVILFCDLIVHGFSNNNVLLKFLRNIGLIMFDKVPYIKPLVAHFAMGLKSVD